MKFRNVGWFTNLKVDKSEDPITPYLTYEQGRKKGLYPKYDNYDAIEVSKIAEIPSDYKGVMGVPITFLDKWVPESGIEIVKFRKGKVPQMGWNKIIPKKKNIFKEDFMYFVNSYYAVPKDDSIIAAMSDYNGNFASAIQSNNVTAMQFHPEKSGKAGIELIKRWLKC